MLRLLMCCCLYFSFAIVSYSQSILSNKLVELNKTIDDAAKYDARKKNSIDSLNEKLKIIPANDIEGRYVLYSQLYNCYKVFKYDSAYNYAFKCQKIAYLLNDPEKIAYASILLNFTLLSAGLFKEAGDSLKSINISTVKDSTKAEYYALKARYYYDLADYTQDNYYTPTYSKIGTVFLDSALSLYLPNSFSYYYFNGLKGMRLGDMNKARMNFTKLISNGRLADHDFAMSASTLSAAIFFQKGNQDSVILLLIQAAIADIKSSTKETSAMYNLAQFLYKSGDIKNASKFIEYAINDASFYGARQRKVQLISILPLIEAEKISRVESQKKSLLVYSFFMTILLIAIIVLAITVYKQFIKLKRAQNIITEASQKKHEINLQLEETNKKLSEMHIKEQEINFRLNETNKKLFELQLKEHEINQALTESNNKLSDVIQKLSESNKIKEEYIGYFFSANSEFHKRIERFKRSVEKKIQDRKFDEIKLLVNQINLKNEKEEALINFDKAFLKLFPRFVDEFNLLFNPEDRIVLKNREILNTDLRIYALIRMGIKDIEKISEILEYSSNTIQNYKSRIKNRSIVKNEEFMFRIMKIESI